MSEWQPIETATEFDRVLVAGWQPPSRTVRGYWWWYEDTIVNGKSGEHPTATHWAPVILPPFPKTPEVKP